MIKNRTAILIPLSLILLSKSSLTEVTSKKLETTFLELNEDVLNVICDSLGFEELVYLAQVNTALNFIANGVFRRKYRNFEIEISHITAESHEQANFSIIETQQKLIQISEFQLALNVLTYFGNMIQKLAIVNTNIDQNRSIVINKIANNYVSHSLTDLYLGCINEDTLQQFTVPFENVEILTCLIYRKPIEDNIMPFNQLFPSLRRLTLTLASDSPYEFINCEITQLKHLEINVSPRGERQIEQMLKKNPQIQSIGSNILSAQIAKCINKNLPNLARLCVIDFNIKNETIHFDNAKHLILYRSSPQSMSKVSFGRLESLEMIYNDDLFIIWMDFFKRHQCLRKLTLKTKESIDGSHLVRLADELANLDELTLELYDCVRNEVVAGIVDKLKKLMKFDILMEQDDKFDVNSLQRRFEQQWNIRSSKSFSSNKQITFKRISISMERTIAT